jgi:hypothetical protein
VEQALKSLYARRTAAMTAAEVREGSRSFLKKSTKKLFPLAVGGARAACTHSQKCLLLFSKRSAFCRPACASGRGVARAGY